MNNPYYNYSGYGTSGPQKVPVVNGREGAEAYRIFPDSQAILMDISGKMVWMIASDSAGYKTIEAYDITRHIEPQPPDYNLIMARMSKMEEMLSELISTNNTAKSGIPNANISDTSTNAVPTVPSSSNANTTANSIASQF